MVKQSREEFLASAGVQTEEPPAAVATKTRRTRRTKAAVVVEEPQKLVGEIRPVDLKDYKGPLYVKNQTKNVISHDDGRGNVFRIDPVGSETALLPLPLEVAQHPGIQKLWRQRKITVSTDPDLEESLFLGDHPEDRGGIIQTAVMENPQSNDLLSFACLIGGEQVFLTRQDMDDDVPPLCEEHYTPSNAARCMQVGENKVWQFN